MAINTTPTPTPNTTLGGASVKLYGEFPQVSRVAPPFPTGEQRLAEHHAGQLRRQAQGAEHRALPGYATLPGFCSSEGLGNVVNLPTMRGRKFMPENSRLMLPWNCLLV